MEPSEDDQFLDWLISSEGYFDAKIAAPGIWVGYRPLMFHWALYLGMMGDKTGYEDRWCYRDLTLVQMAYLKFKIDVEPVGWHRHPRTGRRREDGDPSKEEVRW